jgi:hypothetical protein
MNFFRKRKNTYIQKEFKKIYGGKSPFNDHVTFHIVKTYYLGEILKLKSTKLGRRNVSTKS